MTDMLPCMCDRSIMSCSFYAVKYCSGSRAFILLCVNIPVNVLSTTSNLSDHVYLIIHRFVILLCEQDKYINSSIVMFRVNLRTAYA